MATKENSTPKPIPKVATSCRLRRCPSIMRVEDMRLLLRTKRRSVGKRIATPTAQASVMAASVRKAAGQSKCAATKPVTKRPEKPPSPAAAV